MASPAVASRSMLRPPDLDGVRPVVARHCPHGVVRVLEGLRRSQPSVEASGDPYDEADRASAQALGLGQVPADHRELLQRRCQHLVLQPLVTCQHEAQDRPEHQQQREQRNETVVGEQCWWRRRTGIEPASDAARRSLVLKTRGTTRNPDASALDSTDSGRV
jgi:hypothetical protein